MAVVRQRIAELRGVDLVPEVQLIGRQAPVRA
jgi:UDP-N-acetylenolpyruvoylglucosamine reductase